MRYFEDFKVGDVIESGPYVVSREEIIDFARRYDPQPFHLDEEAGKAMHFGGLVASGWHTAAICHRLMVKGVLEDSSSEGSPGINELRWLKPVRPGDALTLRLEVLECTPSRSKPTRGSVNCLFELRNEAGDVVLRYTGVGMFGRRVPAT